jgi:protocatechuate 3,4-dioxygenase beta subunit
LDNDDVLVGRILSRRELIAFIGAAGALVAVGCGDGDDALTATNTAPAGDTPGSTPTSADGATPTTAVSDPTMIPTCVVSPELIEGPYFVDEELNRSDIRSDPGTGIVAEGAEFLLAINVLRVGESCAPLEGAQVDIWHCDAAGQYSDVADPGFNTAGEKWLRGHQLTDANGHVEFTTIYPGWYQGRATHIHFKVRTGNYEFTSQFFFDEAFTDVVHAQPPYVEKGYRTLLNDGDGIYQQSGAETMLAVVDAGSRLESTFDLGVTV